MKIKVFQVLVADATHAVDMIVLAVDEHEARRKAEFTVRQCMKFHDSSYDKLMTSAVHLRGEV